MYFLLLFVYHIVCMYVVSLQKKKSNKINENQEKITTKTSF